MTDAQRQRQHYRSRGRYSKVNPCEVCGRSAGDSYCSLPDCNSTGFGVCLCDRCYTAIREYVVGAKRGWVE